MPTSLPPLDELLRKYLATEPGEMLAKLQVMVERVANEQQAVETRTQQTFVDHEKKDDERFERLLQAHAGSAARIDRLEKKSSEAPPPPSSHRQNLEQYRSAEGSGAYHIPAHELEAALKQVEARDALAQKQALIKAVGKVAIAIVTAIALFAGGTLWRDLVSPRPQNQTSITTIAPSTAK